MRLFFGLAIDGPTALAIDTWRERQFSGVERAVPAANLHMTLAFAGDVSEAQLDRLGSGVDALVSTRHLPGGNLLLNQTGYWPRPGIYWLGPSEWPDSLSGLASKLAGQVSSIGGRRDKRRFQPHVTLFRGCNSAPPMPAEAPDFDLHYREFALFESRFTRSGVTYDVIARWPLS